MGSVLGFQRSDLHLLRNFFAMQLRDRFLGSALGIVWALVNPLLLLGIFTFVFGFVFQAKAPGSETSLTFVIWLICGYGPWLGLSESVVNATNAVVGNRALVKNMAFRSELLAVAASLTGLIPIIIAMAFLLTLLVIGKYPLTSALLFLPVALALQFLLTAGIGLFLAAVNVFVRDVGFMLPNLLIVLMFASPLFYNIDLFPAPMRPFALWNPVHSLAELYRQPVVNGVLPKAGDIAYVAVLAVASFLLGLRYFRRVKGFFDARL